MRISTLIAAWIFFVVMAASIVNGGDVDGIQPAPVEKDNRSDKRPPPIPGELIKCRDDALRQLKTLPTDLGEMLKADPKLQKKLADCWPKSQKEAEFYHGIDFVDPRRGWVVGWSGRILHTQDGGATWTEQASTTRWPLAAVDFIDKNVGWAAGHHGILLSTRDGGVNWRGYAIPGRYGSYATLSCVPPGRCWAAGDQRSYVSFGSQLVFTKGAGGKRWTRQKTPAKGRIKSIHFLDERMGWAVSAKGEIIGTQDGGNHWELLARRSADYFWSVYFVDAKHGWIVGKNSRILHSGDGGRSWADQSENVHLPPGVKKADARLHVVRFATPKKGWAAGLKGLILATNDGGRTWFTQDYLASHSYTIYAMHMHNSRLGWIAGNHGLSIAATTDGGKNWFPLYGSLSKVLKTIDAAIKERE
jgi:photosystem II stability/assembly factor-like uncharacterized protein